MRPLRPLLPAIDPSKEEPEDSKPQVKNKHIKSLACERCRKHKIKCDSIRPTCGRCGKHKQVCQYRIEQRVAREGYERAQQQNSTYEELFELLRVMPDQDAMEVFGLIKRGMNVADIVRYVRDGSLLMQLSVHPDTNHRYEFPYVDGMPKHLSLLDNPFLDSILYHYMFTSHESSKQTSEDIGVSQTISHKQFERDLEAEGNAVTSLYIAYQMPYHVAQMVDPILDSITAAPWTQVISDDRLLRRLIASYFCYGHPCGPFVHKDLFLHDMAAGRTEFCSPLLVNAVLTIAAQSCQEIPNRSKLWLQDTLTYRFMAEARRLWDLESFEGAKVTTIQAALILSYITTNNGMDNVGHMYMQQACDMGKKIGLLDANAQEIHENSTKGRVFTAWAMFSWQALLSYSFYRSPYLEKPPQIPLPDVEDNPEWYGEIWMRYPRNQVLIPLYLGHKVQAEAALHAIMNELCLRMYGAKSSYPMSLDELIALINKLEHWKYALPIVLQAEKLVLPLHINLHFQYYPLVMAVMQLVLKSRYADDPLMLRTCNGKSPMTVSQEAKTLFETIIRLYFARHGFEFFDPWVAWALTVLGNMVIADLTTIPTLEPDMVSSNRCLLILSTLGLNKQSQNFHVGSLLAFQLQKAMGPANLQLVQTYANAAYISEDDQSLLVQHSYSLFPTPGLIALDEDPEMVRLKNRIAGDSRPV